MFVDKVKVTVQAGDGGNGIVSFRHEKFVDKGGPDGGDGGHGGDVILVASRNQNTLAAFRYQKTIEAKSGDSGSKRKRHGKSAENLKVLVPVGTVAINQDGQTIADLTVDGQTETIAHGGKGGFGNAHFISSRRQAPRIAEKGEKGDSLELTLELKMIADVGLVGLPNAGKSTFLAAVSNARPEIADYPFTTLTPNLGVVDIDDKSSLLIADIPGLIEGASQGKGLGDEFLRHVERTSVLLHIIDAYQPDLAQAYQTIQTELKEYSLDLTKLPQVVALNKIDGMAKKQINQKMGQLQSVVPARTPLFSISAASQQNIKPLLYELKSLVDKQAAKQKRRAAKKVLPVLQFSGGDSHFTVEKTASGFVVIGTKIERFANRTDFGSLAGVERLRDIMFKTGILRELERQGIVPGDKISIGRHQRHSIEF
ncbi:MAG: GTPase ObgE [Candidatus Saccharimonadales bacterium]